MLIFALMRSVLLSIILSLVILSCSKGQFDQIEKTLSQDPQAALQQLDSISASSLGDAEKAYRTLLYMEAEVACYGTFLVTSDEDCRLAGEYFVKVSDDTSMARMWSAVARAQYGKNEFKASAESYKTALEFLSKTHAVADDKLAAGRLRLLIVLLFFLIISVIALNYIRIQKLSTSQKIKEEKAERERYMNIAEELETKLKHAEVAGKPSSPDGFGVLEKLCEQYYVYEGTDNLQPKILKEVKTLIEGLRADSSRVENMLNSSKDSLMTKFREQNSNLKEDDIRLFSFVAAGFSSTIISTLTGKDKQYIYNRIYRLKGRVSASSASDKDLFLSYLQK